MRKFAKIFVALVAVGSLMFVGTSPASADNSKKPAKGSSVSSTEKADKTKNKDKKADKTKKKDKKAKKAKKSAKVKKAKKSIKATNEKRVANFAPIVDPTSDPQTCDPMIDKQCQLVVDPTCDPSIDQWCEIVVDPSPTDEPIVDPSPTDEPIVDPSPTDEPIVDPSPTDEPIVDPSPTDEPTVDPTENSAAWAAYFDTVNKANDDYAAFINSAQADFDAATADAKATRDEAIASATSFADVVKAVKDYRLATADQMAQLQATFSDAQEAYGIILRSAYDKLVADGGLIVIKCWDRDGNQGKDGVHIDPLPPVADQQGAPAQDNQRNNRSHHRER